MDPNIIAIIQIDATVITGFLILLTITNLIQTTKEFWLPKAVSTIVIPFAISALFAIWQLLKDFSTTPEGNFIPISLVVMGIGFLYLISVILTLSTKKYWRLKQRKL